ncbi:MAG: hypothetical protein LGR52_08290 [Candidatus Thiosymbion ectosymbiont of Robbea hypermnestra]|nr:hypothetical protein [Candidatus Thiosymbion ectosymbiont of Robbea hypermnestra]
MIKLMIFRNLKLTRFRQRLVTQIESMDGSELKIVAQSEKSLADYIGSAFREFAQLAGYVIAIPIAYATKIAKEIYKGLGKGWKQAWRNAGFD